MNKQLLETSNYSSFEGEYSSTFQKYQKMLSNLNLPTQIENLLSLLQQKKEALLSRLSLFESTLLNKIQEISTQFQEISMVIEKIQKKQSLSAREIQLLQYDSFDERSFGIELKLLKRHIKILDTHIFPLYPLLSVLEQNIHEYRLRQFYKRHFLNFDIVPEPYKFIKGVSQQICSNEEEIYIGETRNLKKHGRGFYINKYSQRIYEGVFVDNQFVWGQMTYLNSSGNQIIYRGQVTENKKQGQGQLIFSNWDYFKGGFLDNKYTGYGKYYSQNGDLFRGIFEKGKKINGIETYYDGNSYEGEFMNSSQHGQGIFYYSDEYSIGEYIDGNRVGVHEFYHYNEQQPYKYNYRSILDTKIMKNDFYNLSLELFILNDE